MADEFAIVVLDAPLAVGAQDFTDPKITDWSAAILFISGDYLGEGSSAQVSSVIVKKAAASETVGAYLAAFSRSGATGTGQARHFAQTSTSGNDIVRVMDPATNGADWARGSSSDLSNGFRITWSDVSGFSAGRRVKIVALLFGKTDVHLGQLNGNLSFFTPGVTPEQLFAVCKRGAYGGLSNNDLSIGLGGAVDGVTIEQAAVAVNWPHAADPITAGTFASEVEAWADINAAAGAPTTADATKVTDFIPSGFEKDGADAAAHYLGFAWIDNRQGFCRIVDLTGSESGSTLLLNLGRHVEVVVGMFVGATSEDAVVTGEAAQAFGLFVFDGLSSAHSVSAAIDEGLDPDITATLGFSRYKADEWNVVDGAGGTAWRVTGLSSTAEGLRGSVVTAKAGRLFLWGVSRIASIQPPAVPVALVLPAPTRLQDGSQVPGPTALPLVLPAPAVLMPKQPSAVLLALTLASPTIIAQASAPTPKPELGPLYAQALSSLLPRGLAWPRRPSS